MLLLRRKPRPGRAPTPLRTRLTAEPLGGRYAPSGFGPGLDPVGGSPVYTPSFSGPTNPPPPAPVPGNVAPQIVGFTAEDLGGGQFRFTGTVVDEAPGGLTVGFGGSVGSVRGKSAVTNSDGTFTLVVRLKTDGSDSGTVTAQTKDRQGLASNVASVDVSPTPP
ncbi:MAG: hypothetical protein K2X82_20590 [Gemmataceae bacterium]|nr:hypothetical protein [Gemmataceae bacterium]